MAHAYGLLRLPKMRELSGRKDLEKFKRSEIDTSTIKYANPTLERKRTEVTFSIVRTVFSLLISLFQIMAQKHERRLKAKKENTAKKLSKKGKDGKVTKKDGVQNKKDKVDKCMQYNFYEMNFFSRRRNS